MAKYSYIELYVFDEAIIFSDMQNVFAFYGFNGTLL